MKNCFIMNILIIGEKTYKFCICNFVGPTVITSAMLAIIVCWRIVVFLFKETKRYSEQEYFKCWSLTQPMSNLALVHSRCQALISEANILNKAHPYINAKPLFSKKIISIVPVVDHIL
ncbi:hypothetical protein BDC45DRAFT_540190 [Circinella umbellata]|nr:hypothetical protein BDC45DRAFT_540190 [Circinella umbellata]